MKTVLSGIFNTIRPHILKGLSVKKVGINSKGDVTKYFDKFCETKIISILRKLPVKATIISEELKHPLIINPSLKTQMHYIIIDPVDGSDNYLSGVPFVCLGIAVFDGNMEPLYSLAGNYYTGDWFYADRRALFLNGKKFDAVKAAKKPNDIIYFAFTDTAVNLDNKFRKIFLYESGKVRSLGATIGELILVIKGGAKSFIDIRNDLTPENFAPFFLIAKHTKACFTDEYGMDFRLKSKRLTDGYNVVFSNNRHEHAKTINKLGQIL
jgi:fructose-1,6-bisphosphatase/inositol monophosphatase family enzyme